MAADINKVIIIGNLTRDAEQSYTQSGYALLKFSIAVNRRRKQGDQWVEEASYFDVTLFGPRAEAIALYMTKGKKVAVEGQLQQDRWEDKNDGSKRSKVIIIAENIQFLSTQSPGNSGQVSSNTGQLDPAAPTPGQTPQAMGGSPKFEDDIPW